MQCKFCFTELIQDQFGLYCPDESCISIDGSNRDVQEGWNRIENNLCLICGEKETHSAKIIEVGTRQVNVSYCAKHLFDNLGEPNYPLNHDVNDFEEEFVFRNNYSFVDE